MLEKLNPLVEKERDELENVSGLTAIDHLCDQNFAGRKVGFEQFMSTLNALKLAPAWMTLKPNNFRKYQRVIQAALRTYLSEKVESIMREKTYGPIAKFVAHVDWAKDVIFTFNYDMLLERTLRAHTVSPSNAVVHLHGSIDKDDLVYPVSHKFAYQTMRKPFQARWLSAFNLLRDHSTIDRLVFIGYSMPQSDLEARGLFNYADRENYLESLPRSIPMMKRKGIPATRCYAYDIQIVNPDAGIVLNYDFFRKPISFHRMTMQDYLASKA